MFSLLVTGYLFCTFIAVLLQELIVFSLKVTILLSVEGFIMMSLLFKDM